MSNPETIDIERFRLIHDQAKVGAIFLKILKDEPCIKSFTLTMHAAYHADKESTKRLDIYIAVKDVVCVLGAAVVIRQDNHKYNTLQEMYAVMVERRLQANMHLNIYKAMFTDSKEGKVTMHIDREKVDEFIESTNFNGYDVFQRLFAVNPTPQA